MFFRQVPLMTMPQIYLGQSFEDELKTRLAPLQEGLRAGVVAFVEQKQEEIKKTVIHAALIGGGVGLVIGVFISPIIRDLLGVKK